MRSKISDTCFAMPKEFPWFMLSLFMMILALYGLVVQHGSSYGINLQLWVQIGSHHEQFSFKGAFHSLDTYRGFTCGFGQVRFMGGGRTARYIRHKARNRVETGMSQMPT